MKTVFEFNLPEDDVNLRLALMGPGLHSAIFGFDQWLRGKLKYGHSFKSADEALEAARDELRSELDDLEIKFDSIP